MVEHNKLLGLMVAPALWLPATGVLLPERTTAQSAPAPVTDAAARLAEGDRLLEQGNQQYQVSQFQEALESLEQAVELYQNSDVRTGFTLESTWGAGNALRGLGNIYFSLGEYETALDFYQQALEVFSQTADSQDELLRQGAGNALNNLGNVYYKLGEYEQAYDFYEQALEIAREIGDKQGEGRVLNNLGLATARFRCFLFCPLFEFHVGVIAPGNDNLLGQAVDFLEEALNIFREMGDLQGESSTLGNLGNTYANAELYQEAFEQYQQALT